MKHDIDKLPPWELMSKKMIWRQLGAVRGKRILDFGSGEGVRLVITAAMMCWRSSRRKKALLGVGRMSRMFS